MTDTHQVVFSVIDVLDAPHRGWILKLRIKSGEAPSIKELRGSEMVMRSGISGTRKVRIAGYPAIGGRPSDDRLARTGRIDVHVEPVDGGAEEAPAVMGRWELAGPA